mgnify:CR=1 FL=1
MQGLFPQLLRRTGFRKCCPVGMGQLCFQIVAAEQSFVFQLLQSLCCLSSLPPGTDADHPQSQVPQLGPNFGSIQFTDDITLLHLRTFGQHFDDLARPVSAVVVEDSGLMRADFTLYRHRSNKATALHGFTGECCKLGGLRVRHSGRS